MYTVDHLEKRGIKISSVRGDEVIAHCPFHIDAHPSFAANLRKGVFICFACGERGTFRKLGVDQVPKVHWGDFSKLLKTEEVGMIFELPRGFKEIDGKEKESVYLQYLKSRQIDGTAIKRFNIGFCESGIYHDRVVIPFETGFVARTIFDGFRGMLIYGKKHQRYLYPLGLPTSKLLFNFNPTNKYLLLVEGVFDALRLATFGYPATAILGCQLHSIQLERLCLSEAENVFVCFDGDEAGRYGAKIACQQLSKFFKVYQINLPDGLDPGSPSLSIADFRRALGDVQLFSRGVHFDVGFC